MIAAWPVHSAETRRSFRKALWHPFFRAPKANILILSLPKSPLPSNLNPVFSSIMYRGYSARYFKSRLKNCYVCSKIFATFEFGVSPELVMHQIQTLRIFCYVCNDFLNEI